MQDVPLLNSDPWFRSTTALDRLGGGTVTVSFDFKWNDRDQSWYFDVIDDQERPIVNSVRLVLGVYLGRHSRRHELFRNGALVAINTSRATADRGREAGFNDLGARVILRYFTVNDIMVGRGNLSLALQPSKVFTDG
jgi:hypothetical protein